MKEALKAQKSKSENRCEKFINKKPYSYCMCMEIEEESVFHLRKSKEHQAWKENILLRSEQNSQAYILNK